GELDARLDLLAEHGGDGEPLAEGNVGELRAGPVPQGGAGEVGEAPLPGVADPDLARVLLGVGDELANVLPGGVGLDGEAHRLGGQLGDPVEGAIVEVHVPGVIGGADAVRVPDDGVAVGRLLVHVVVADGPARSGPIHD